MGRPPFSCALIGFGQVAEKAHWPAFLSRRDHFAVSAVAEADPGRRERARALIPSARIYEDRESLFENERGLDIAVIATPPLLHAPQASAALDHGCHVLCEKPLSLSSMEILALRKKAVAADRALFTVHNWAYSPHWLKIFSLFEDGSLSPLREATVSVARTRPAAGALDDWRRDPARAGGGILVDHGWHGLYLLRRLLGSAPYSIHVERMEPADPDRADEETVLSLRTNFAQASLSLTWGADVRSNTAEFRDDRGRRLALEDDSLLLTAESGRSKSFFFDRKLSAGSAHPDWFAVMLDDFREAVAGGPARRRNEEEASFCADVIETAYAWRRRKPQTVP